MRQQQDPTARDHLKLLASLADDPWSLTHAERRRALSTMAACQARWLPRLGRLVEPPGVGPDFPAFLLETPALMGLRAAIGSAADPLELDTATADQVQRFVDTYRCYLVWSEEQCEREDAGWLDMGGPGLEAIAGR